MSATLTLAIETTNPGPRGAPAACADPAVGPGVALGRGDSVENLQVLGTERLASTARHDDALMPAIERLCNQCSISPSELSRVAVSLGPGGFTSVRIAVATAKMICEATGAACVGVETASALMRRAEDFSPSQPVSVLLAWKRGDVWRQRFEFKHDRWTPSGPGLVVSLTDLARGDPQIIADPELLAILPTSGALPAGARVRRPTFDPTAVLEASLGEIPVDPALLAPLYPREPEAVSKWRDLHSRDR